MPTIVIYSLLLTRDKILLKRVVRGGVEIFELHFGSVYVCIRVVGGRLYGIIMKTNVFDFTLFFSSASLFSRYDILQVPINLGSKVSAFFCEIYFV